MDGLRLLKFGITFGIVLAITWTFFWTVMPLNGNLLPVFGIALGIVVVIAFIMLPFAVLAMKDLLKEALKELKTLRELFERIEAGK